MLTLVGREIDGLAQHIASPGDQSAYLDRHSGHGLTVRIDDAAIHRAPRIQLERDAPGVFAGDVDGKRFGRRFESVFFNGVPILPDRA